MVILLVMGAGALWLAVVRTVTAPPPEPTADPLPEGLERPKRAPPRARRPAPAPAPEAVPADGGPEAWFPEEQVFRCDAPADLADGRYTAPGAAVLVQGGATVVASSADGSGLVRHLGSVVGRLAWSGDGCAWSAPVQHAIVGQVRGGGEHLVAGCPVGEVMTTAPDGSFTTFAYEGQPCALRTVGEGDRLAMGQPVQVAATEPTTVDLVPAIALPERQVAMAETLLARVAADRLHRAREAQAAWAARPADDPWVRMMQASTAREVAYFESEQARLDDPATSGEVVAEFLLGLAN